MTLTLFQAHGTRHALGFKRHQRRDVNDRASDLVWLPRYQVKIVRRSPPRVGEWVETVVEIPDHLARRKGLSPDSP